MFEIALIQSLVRQTHRKAFSKSLPSLYQPLRSPPSQEESDNWRVRQVRKHLLSFLAPHSSFLIREREPDREGGIQRPRLGEKEGERLVNKAEERREGAEGSELCQVN